MARPGVHGLWRDADRALQRHRGHARRQHRPPAGLRRPAGRGGRARVPLDRDRGRLVLSRTIVCARDQGRRTTDGPGTKDHGRTGDEGPWTEDEGPWTDRGRRTMDGPRTKDHGRTEDEGPWTDRGRRTMDGPRTKDHGRTRH